MIRTARGLRRGGASLLAAACLLAACSGPSANPADDTAADEAPADDRAADAPTDDQPADDQPADDTPADGKGAPVDDSEVDGALDADDGATTGDGRDPDDTGAGPGNARGPLPRFLTEDTPDGRYTMTVDDSATLELPQGTTSPTVDGTAVEVFDVASFAGSGVAQWEIRAVEPGGSTISATVDDGRHIWAITVED